jgi:endogenous inhibitor of DNA gyrase (YacG/DUF329 family)
MRIDDLPDSAFPKKPTEWPVLCLICEVTERRRHSWFCSRRCEELFIQRWESEHEVGL